MENSSLPIIEKLKEVYMIWQQILPHISKSQRQTIGAKIDGLLLDALESAFQGRYALLSKRLNLITNAVTKIDSVKFFLLVGWENKVIDDKKYIRLSEKLVEASKMLVNWKEYLRKLPPNNAEERKE
ncbi:MAG: four helix bundle protein [Candidatus Paceibacterota bacterium]|jgi:hypothetical protein